MGAAVEGQTGYRAQGLEETHSIGFVVDQVGENQRVGKDSAEAFQFDEGDQIPKQKRVFGYKRGIQIAKQYCFSQ